MPLHVIKPKYLEYKKKSIFEALTFKGMQNCKHERH